MNVPRLFDDKSSFPAERDGQKHILRRLIDRAVDRAMRGRGDAPKRADKWWWAARKQAPLVDLIDGPPRPAAEPASSRNGSGRG